MKRNAILAGVLMLLLLVGSITYGVEVVQLGTMVSARGWLFSQSTPFGIYYGFGSQGSGYNYDPPVLSNIYYYDFTTGANTLIKSQSSQPDINLLGVTNATIWGDTIYSAIIGDKIFFSSVYYDYPTHEWRGLDELEDMNGLYALDTQTNSFYLYDRLPFDFFVDNWPSPMTAVGSDLYFFVGIPDRPDIARRVYKYNPETKQVTVLAELPGDLGAGGILYVAGSKVYITTYNWGTENSIYVYDTLANNFTYLATNPLIPSNNYGANSVINEKLYFVGGEEPINDTVLGRIVEYDPSTNQFTIIGNLSYGLMGASTTSVGGTLYIVGGEVHSEPEVTDQITAIVIDPSYDFARTVVEYLFKNNRYKNHGDFVSYVAKKANEFLKSGLITEEERGKIVSEAAKLSAGMKKK